MAALNKLPVEVTYRDVTVGPETDWFRGDLCNNCEFHTTDRDTTVSRCANMSDHIGWMKETGPCLSPLLFTCFNSSPYLRWESYSPQLNYVEMKFRPTHFDSESYQCYNPCQNNATCSYSVENGSTCLCENGFQGVHCEGQPAAYVVNNDEFRRLRKKFFSSVL
ncbi:hypothetical protein NP493_311g00031 [Ridgeia piscesae]|uniref:EGF-like domain-containing protein n=1 Tax=Ridgeia piscesae TaxID=27915 RepID=A0AAD9L5N7_RIDPI|nr:hypothetical protein NP493_311g00031 [Ridgeia piscesae]